MALFSWRNKRKQKAGDDEGEMSFLEHLEELRWHIFRSVVGIVLFAIVLFSYRQEVIGGIFMSPFKKDFITYRILCENFGQFCDSEVEVESFQAMAPDSLLLEGYLNDFEEREQWKVDTLSQDTLADGQVLLQLDSSRAPPSLVMVRRKVELKVSIEDFKSNGAIQGFSVETEQGSMVRFQATSPYEQFMKALFYAFFGGLIFAFPYVSWEIWSFIKPALSPKEARTIRWNVATSSFLFFFGIAFGYFVILPFSINFLSSFVLFDEADNIWRIGDVVNFVLLLLFGTGFLFQLPVVVFYLSRLGLTTPRGMRKYRKHAVVALLVIAAIITPPDPMSQVLIFFPLMLLYEVGIMISGRVEKKRKRKEEAEREKDVAYREKKIEELKAEAAQVKAKAKQEEQPKESAEAESEAEEDEGPQLGPPPGSISRE